MCFSSKRFSLDVHIFHCLFPLEAIVHFLRFIIVQCFCLFFYKAARDRNNELRDMGNNPIKLQVYFLLSFSQELNAGCINTKRRRIRSSKHSYTLFVQNLLQLIRYQDSYFIQLLNHRIVQIVTKIFRPMIFFLNLNFVLCLAHKNAKKMLVWQSEPNCQLTENKLITEMTAPPVTAWIVSFFRSRFSQAGYFELKYLAKDRPTINGGSIAWNIIPLDVKWLRIFVLFKDINDKRCPHVECFLLPIVRLSVWDFAHN